MAEVEGDGQEEQVMSEIHLGCPPRFSGLHISFFTVSSPPQPTPPAENKLLTDVEVDGDGDLVLDRKNKADKVQNYRLRIQHNVTSSLRNVGMQVWKASLLLADFLLHKSTTSSEFNGIGALELGAGTGLVGIVLARVAGRVFITDKGREVLENCEANAQMNSVSRKYHSDVFIRELEWETKWPPPVLNMLDGRFAWSSREIEEAENATVLLAADVIYSDDLTDLLFGTLEKLMSTGAEKVLYLTLEKRYNFSLDDLDIVANGYAHFRSFIDEDGECGSLDAPSATQFRGEQIDLSTIPQYIEEYERGNDLEMWKITYCQQQ